MDRAELLERFQGFPIDTLTSRTARGLFNYLHWFFKEQVKSDHEYSGMYDSIPLYIVEAMELLRTSQDPTITAFRKGYEDNVQEKGVPAITKVGYGGVSRALTVGELSHLMSDVMGIPEISGEIRGYCFAEDNVLDHKFREFLREVGNSGLFEVIDECSQRGMSGLFGSTDLRSYITAGRIMLTFAQRKDGETVFYGLDGEEAGRLDYREESVSFVGDDDNRDRFGLQSCHADLFPAVTMIDEVINSWPSDINEQKSVYKSDEAVSLI